MTDHHRQILDERRKKLAEGSAEFVDWNLAV
ncbi:MAG: addiction module protein [Gemmataceae bacterium]